MHVCKFNLPGNVIISCYVRGEGTPSMVAYTGGSARNPGEVLNKYLYGEAPPRGPTPYPSRKRSIFVTDSYFMTVRVSSS